MSREVDHVSHALAGITAVLDPELVVLGGGVGSQPGDLLTARSPSGCATSSRLMPL